MSKIFYDSLLSLDRLHREIHKLAHSHEERAELWQIIDEALHLEIMETILDHLDQEHHEEFLIKFHETPHDQELIAYLNERTERDIIVVIEERVERVSEEILVIISEED